MSMSTIELTAEAAWKTMREYRQRHPELNLPNWDVSIENAITYYKTNLARLEEYRQLWLELEKQKSIWQPQGISVNLNHDVGCFPTLSLSLNLTGMNRDCDTILEQELLAKEIAALVTKHTQLKEKGGDK